MARKGGREPLSRNDPTERFTIRIPNSLKTKLTAKVADLRTNNVKVDSSKLIRVIMEKNIDTAERYFAQEILTR